MLFCFGYTLFKFFAILCPLFLAHIFNLKTHFLKTNRIFTC